MIYSGYNNSQLGCFEFLTLRVQFVVANSSERVYFEQHIFAFNLDKTMTGATIGHNVAAANNNLQFATTIKKNETNSS